MTRTFRTLLLSAAALGALATAAAADPAAHDVMLDAPAMQAHMADHDVDIDQMRQWHDAGTSMTEMHRSAGHHDMLGGDRP
jgi:hypothetical protein